jgi:alanine racemase
VVDLRELRAGDTVSYGATWRAPGPRRIATVAAGYADGYRRALAAHGVALLDGREVPVAGLVTMDMTMLDVTGVPCAVGDVATLLGRDGDRVLTVADVAGRGDLSPYELLAGLRLRLPHVHLPA